jgi:hypothetical protein
MAGSLESLIWIMKAATVVLPLLITLYGLLKRPKDNRIVGTGLLTAVIVSVVWFLAYQRETHQYREIEALKKTIEESHSKTAVRGFSPDERRILLERLRDIHGPSVFILANSTDEETIQYAREIGSILKEAGWDVPPSFGMIFAPVIFPGQEAAARGVVLGVSPEVPQHIADGVLESLRAAGVHVSMGPHWPGTDLAISLLVGPKAPSAE